MDLKLSSDEIPDLGRMRTFTCDRSEYMMIQSFKIPNLVLVLLRCSRQKD